MFILFLTSSLEPGRDGVGDHTRLLAFESVRQNQQCGLIALNDRHIADPVEAVETAGGLSIATLRLPATMSWEKKIGLASAFRARYPVRSVSLQFVSYGFHPKGIVRNLARQLHPIVAGIPVHIMFHEIWIGVEKTSPLKHRIMGRIQRFYIQKLVRQLGPQWVTTTNSLYRALLATVGIPAALLPLFTNLAVTPDNGDLHLPENLVRSGWCDKTGAHPGRSIGLFFGTLYPEWKPEPFMSILIAASAHAHRRSSLVSVGRQGPFGATVWKKLQDDYAHAVDFLDLGELPSDQISALMQRADFGVAASPLRLLGKSSSAATMLDHGLPVIVTRDDFHPIIDAALPDDPLIHGCDAALESKLAAGLPRRSAKDRVVDVARDFINGLTKSKTDCL